MREESVMRLVTWNIQWGRGVDGRVDLERIVRDARRLADFDVLCLQEVSAACPELPGCDGSDQFAALAALLPDYTAVCGAATDAPRLLPAAQGGSRFGKHGVRRRFGNMILTRLPVGQVFSQLLPWPAQEGVKSMQRAALEITVETAVGPLRITTTHLEYYSQRQRIAQVERLRELHREGTAHARFKGPGTAADGPFEFLPRGVGSVLVGDFNFRPEAPERAQLLAAFDDPTPPYIDAWERLHPGQAHAPTVGLHDKAQWPDEPFTFDFVFVSEDLAARAKALRVEAGTAASDHQPMLLELGCDA
jgi:endonuclease/exonuclease/phosphatase family metal-dependent hydrolase